MWCDLQDQDRLRKLKTQQEFDRRAKEIAERGDYEYDEDDDLTERIFVSILMSHDTYDNKLKRAFLYVQVCIIYLCLLILHFSVIMLRILYSAFMYAYFFFFPNWISILLQTRERLIQSLHDDLEKSRARIRDFEVSQRRADLEREQDRLQGWERIGFEGGNRKMILALCNKFYTYKTWILSVYLSGRGVKRNDTYKKKCFCMFQTKTNKHCNRSFDLLF